MRRRTFLGLVGTASAAAVARSVFHRSGTRPIRSRFRRCRVGAVARGARAEARARGVPLRRALAVGDALLRSPCRRRPIRARSSVRGQQRDDDQRSARDGRCRAASARTRSARSVEIGPFAERLWQRTDVLDRMRIIVQKHNLEPPRGGARSASPSSSRPRTSTRIRSATWRRCWPSSWAAHGAGGDHQRDHHRWGQRHRAGHEHGRKMVCEWGMSDLGPATFGKQGRAGLPRPRVRPAPGLLRGHGRRDRQEVRRILDKAYKTAQEIITETATRSTASPASCSSARLSTAGSASHHGGNGYGLHEAQGVLPVQSPSESMTIAPGSGPSTDVTAPAAPHTPDHSNA